MSIRRFRFLLPTSTVIFLLLITLAPASANEPASKEGDWVARDFRFHTGEIMPESKILHYNYDDMVIAHYRLVTGGLGLRPLRLVLGNSMGPCTPGSGV